jgi:hypothetical protein
VTPTDQPKTHLGQRAKQPNESTGIHEEQLLHRNLRRREIRSADSVGRIEPHGDKNETDKICGGGNPRRTPVLSEQTIKPWRPAELACALGAAPTVQEHSCDTGDRQKKFGGKT